jgi:hypothetical protein
MTHLNLPILEQLTGAKSILIAGTGGGFDVFCGLPIYFELRRLGKEVHLANFSQSDVSKVRGGLRLTPTLIGVVRTQASRLTYFPELYLAQWFSAVHGVDVPIWCFAETGVRPLRENYKALIDYLSIDAIVLVDGGVDSLMRGDETEWGSPTMDALTLAAVSKLDSIKTRILACIGFGAEREVTYSHVLENIAQLTEEDAFLGSCSLTKRMAAYKFYEDAVLYVQANPHQKPSIINSSVISAVRGSFGDHHLTSETHGHKLWISPLMSLFWFFELDLVARRNLLIAAIEETETLADAEYIIQTLAIPKRSHSTIPLT